MSDEMPSSGSLSDNYDTQVDIYLRSSIILCYKVMKLLIRLDFPKRKIL